MNDVRLLRFGLSCERGPMHLQGAEKILPPR